MPTRDKTEFPFPDRDPDQNRSPFSVSDEDAMWILLNTYVDGEATPEEAAQAEALLHSHPEYARDFAFLQLTSESVREFTEVEPPAALMESILAATTRRKTWKQRARALWASLALTTPTMRLGLAGTALAAGTLAVLFWPRPEVNDSPRPRVSENSSAKMTTPTAHPLVKRNAHPDRNSGAAKPGGQLASARRSGLPDPANTPHIANATQSPRDFARPEHSPMPRPILPDPKNAGIVKNTDPRPDKPSRTKPDPNISSGNPSVAIATNSSATEMRHMAAGSMSDMAVQGTPDTGLGQDVHTAAMVDPPAQNPDEDTTRVETVAYKPGSISEKVRATPPSLAMRANEAIKREHELQKYGGYDKDTYNNIQRGEVGVSLVGGKF